MRPVEKSFQLSDRSYQKPTVIRGLIVFAAKQFSIVKII